jgi:hypothetical protein
MLKYDKRKKSWVLYTSDGSRILGEHESREDALRQERAIWWSKSRKNGNLSPIPTATTYDKKQKISREESRILRDYSRRIEDVVRSTAFLDLVESGEINSVPEHCFVAVDALQILAWTQLNLYLQVMRSEVNRNLTHYFLKDPNSDKIFDPTAHQFTESRLDEIYSTAKPTSLQSRRRNSLEDLTSYTNSKGAKYILSQLFRENPVFKPHTYSNLTPEQLGTLGRQLSDLENEVYSGHEITEIAEELGYYSEDLEEYGTEYLYTAGSEGPFGKLDAVLFAFQTTPEEMFVYFADFMSHDPLNASVEEKELMRDAMSQVDTLLYVSDMSARPSARRSSALMGLILKDFFNALVSKGSVGVLAQMLDPSYKLLMKYLGRPLRDQRIKIDLEFDINQTVFFIVSGNP